MLEVSIFNPDRVLKAELKPIIGISLVIGVIFEFVEMQDQGDNVAI